MYMDSFLLFSLLLFLMDESYPAPVYILLEPYLILSVNGT